METIEIGSDRMKKLDIITATVLLCAVIISALFSAYAFTKGDFEYTLSNNKATIIAYHGNASNLTIPSELTVTLSFRKSYLKLPVHFPQEHDQASYP